jgi:hypothetical protein
MQILNPGKMKWEDRSIAFKSEYAGKVTVFSAFLAGNLKGISDSI